MADRDVVKAGQDDVDGSRRTLGAALLGTLGIAALSGCTNRVGEDKESAGRLTQAWTNADPLRSVSWIGTAPTPPNPPHKTNNNLRNLVGIGGTNSEVIIVERFWDDGDNGGGGVFYWTEDTTTRDDGGTVIVPYSSAPVPPNVGQNGQESGAGGCWKRIYSGPIDVRWFGAKADAYPSNQNPTDDTVAIQRAVDTCGLSGGGTVYLPKGTYKISASILVSRNCVRVDGAGGASTTVLFVPSGQGPSTAVVFSSGSSELWYCGIRNIKFASSDRAHAKTMIRIADARGFVAESITSCENSVELWTSDAQVGPSVGIEIRGREEIRIRDCYLYADAPIRIGENLNLSTNSLDHSSIEGTLLSLPEGRTGACIEFFEEYPNPNLSVSQVAFRDISFNRGSCAIKFRSTSTLQSRGIHIENCRAEQGLPSTTTYCFDFENLGGNTEIQFLTIKNVELYAHMNGIRLRTVHMALLDSVFFSAGEPHVALDANGSNRGISVQNMYWETGNSVLGGASALQFINCHQGGSSPVYTDLGLPTSNVGLPAGALWVDASAIVKRV